MREKRCPQCDSMNTTRQSTEHLGGTIEVVRTCGDCPTSFTAVYVFEGSKVDYTEVTA